MEVVALWPIARRLTTLTRNYSIHGESGSWVCVDVGAGVLAVLALLACYLGAVWLGRCWACTVGSWGCATFDAAEMWVAGGSTTAKHSGAT